MIARIAYLISCVDCGGLTSARLPKTTLCRRCSAKRGGFASRRDARERFWTKVDRSGECWIWTGARVKSSRNPVGYGSFAPTRTNTQLAHRVSYEWACGPIPFGLWVLHHCDNPPCVRPDHLFLGTAAHNAADMVAKGRSATGERNGSHTRPERRVRGANHWLHRFDEGHIAAMTAALKAGESLPSVASRFSIDPSYCWKLTGKPRARIVRSGQRQQ